MWPIDTIIINGPCRVLNIILLVSTSYISEQRNLFVDTHYLNISQVYNILTIYDMTIIIIIIIVMIRR